MRRPILQIFLPVAIGALVVGLWYALRHALSET